MPDPDQRHRPFAPGTITRWSPRAASGRVPNLLRRIVRLTLVVLPLAGTVAVDAQVNDLTPVAVDDSPVADRLLAEIEAQIADNPARAAALAAELLDGYAHRVVLVPGEPEIHRSVREAVLEVLGRDGAVRDVWRERFDEEADRILVEAGEAEVWRRRPMTAAGLEAGLRLAQRDIERGAPEAGLAILSAIENWPGATSGPVGDRMDLLEALAWIEIAATGVDAEAPSRREAAIEQVRRRDASAADWLVSIDRSDLRSPDVGLADRLQGETDWTVLWEIPLEESLFQRRTIDSSTGRSLHSNPERVVRNGSFLTTLPAVSGDLLIVNEGRLLEGIDRYTGRLRWYRDHGVGRIGALSGIPGDLGKVVIHQGDAYTVLGHASPTGRTEDRAVVRFDPETGLERWLVYPARLDDDPQLEDARPSGPPLVMGDLVLLPLRKSTGRLETIDLVLALDRADGSVRWVRAIASSGSVRTSDPRPVSALAPLEGDVIVSAAAGAVARLDARTGEIRWLRREDVPLRGVSSTSLPWQIAGPVTLDAGIATLDAARRHWQLLDPETGALLERHPIGPGTNAGLARWLAVVPGGVEDGRDLLLAIGDDVRVIHPRSPDVEPWSLRSTTASLGIPFGTLDDSGVRGRVHVSDRGILVPVVDGLLLVDPVDGRPRRIIDLAGPVNAVFAPDAIHAAGADAVATMMPVLEAVATLERRIRGSGDSVAQAIALIELAGRIERNDLLLLAAEAAVDGLDSPDGAAWRDEVLDLLLDAVPSTSDEEGAILLDFAARAADDVQGRVRHRLARAAWLAARGRADQAAAAWSDVMMDPEAASVMVRITDDHEVSAGAMARDRFASVLDEHPDLRRRLAGEADQTVLDVLQKDADPTALIQLAVRWAGDDAGTTATRLAIERLRDRGDGLSVAALAQVAARHLDPDDPSRDAILSAAAEACEAIGRIDLALALRGLQPGEPGSSSPLPALPGEADHLDALVGRLVAASPVATGSPPNDLVLLFEPDTLDLVARDAATLEVRWRRPVDREHLVVGWSPDLLVWEGIERREPVLSALDLETGEVRWATPQASRVLPLPDRLAVNADGFLPNGSTFLPFQVIPLPVEAGIALVRRDGCLSMLDPADGRTVLWSRRDVMDRVHGVTEAGGLLHLHGSGLDESGEREGRLVSLDQGTGEIVLSERVGSGELRWLVADGLGRVAVGTTTEVQCFDPALARLGSGDRWIRRGVPLGDSMIGWMDGGDLVLVDDEVGINGWELSTGRSVSDRWNVPAGPDEPLGRPLGSLVMGDHRILHFDGRLLVHRRDGTLVGADGMQIPGRRDWRLLPTAEGLLLVTRVSNASTGAVHRVQMLDPAAGLRLSGRPFEISGRPRYAEARVVDGLLLLGTATETHAIPMRAETPPVQDPPAGP